MGRLDQAAEKVNKARAIALKDRKLKKLHQKIKFACLAEGVGQWIRT